MVSGTRSATGRALDESARLAAEESLRVLERAWTCVDDLAHADRRARRLLALHDLRAADALQLAAALVACDEQPTLLPFVTLDRRLADAARREGYSALLQRKATPQPGCASPQANQP